MNARMSRRIGYFGLMIALAVASLFGVSLAINPLRVRAEPRITTSVCAGSLQACLDAASDGDTVIIPAGTYTESLTLNKAITLTGVNSATTIIHAIEGQRVLTVTGAPISASIVISGFTLMGGHAATGGSLLKA
jgi:nitrous oxidase accessory protein NosD